jgi:hypothetical protein
MSRKICALMQIEREENMVVDVAPLLRGEIKKIDFSSLLLHNIKDIREV